MNTEILIAKGVEKHFDGQKVLFKVDSLKEHFDGLLIHESDILEIQEEVQGDDDGTEKQFVQVQYVIASDVNFDNAVAKEVAPKVEEEPYEESEEGTVGIVTIDTPEEADALIKEANAEIEVIEPEVVEPEIVAPEVIVPSKTPAEE